MKLYHERNNVRGFVSKHQFLLIVLVTSLLPFIPFFASQDLLHTHDGLVHLPRLAAYFKSLEDGSIPVRFAGYLNYGYGLPLFNFIYQTPYLIGSIFLLLGFSLANAFKLSLLLSFILSGLFMFLFGKAYFEDEKKAFLLAIFYQFVPFRMVELLVRGSFGEVYTYAFLPLVLYGLVRMHKKRHLMSGFIIASIGQALLVISHNSVSLLFTGAVCLFVLVTFKSFRIFLSQSMSIACGLLLSAFYWIPAMLEHKYTYGNLYMKNLYQDHFVPIQNFFIPNFTNNPSLQTEGITTFIGAFQVIAIVLAVIIFTSKKVDNKTKKLFIFAFILLLISFFFMLPISESIWGAPFSNFLRQFQFPWRFLSLIVIATACLSISIFSVKIFQNKAMLLLVGFLTIVSVVFFFNTNLGYKKIDENYYWNFPLNTTYYGETDVIWSAGPAKSYPKSRIEIISGKGKVSDFKKQNHVQTFTSHSDEEISVVAHTQYFPGWRAFVDGSEVPIQFQDPNHRGLLVFTIPKGDRAVRIEFGENKLRLFSDMVSIVSALLLLPFAIFIKRSA